MKLYRTIKKEAYFEQTIEKSKFICHLNHVESKEDADLYISEIRKKYKDATHNVPAFIVGNKMEMMWQSDDSEPQGTAGAPILDILKREGITNVVAVVTRYFGGIKLGTGGLVKAYQSSAKMALENAVICDAYEMTKMSFSIDYNTYQKIESLRNKEFEIIDKIFNNDVTITIVSLKEISEDVLKMITNLSNGKAKQIDSIEEVVLKEIK